MVNRGEGNPLFQETASNISELIILRILILSCDRVKICVFVNDYANIFPVFLKQKLAEVNTALYY